MKPKDVMKWKESDWKNRVKYMLPSSGGMIGVVFVWVDKPPNGRPKPPTSQFVIKPIQGSAAPTKFAEFMLRKVAGAVSPHTKGIKHSPEGDQGRGKVVEETLLKFKNREPNRDIQARWNQVWPYYQNADCYLIQETQTSIREFEDEAKALWGLSTILTTASLMENLGKLFVADAIIGNGDRLYQVNGGNILFKPNGKLCAIDSATILTNYHAVLNDVTENSWGGARDAPTPDVWVRGNIRAKNFGNTPGAIPSRRDQIAFVQNGKFVGTPLSFPIDHVFDAKRWFKDEFKGTFERAFSANHMMDQFPEEFEWEIGEQYFLKGVQIGMKDLDRKLSGFNWLLVKLNYKKYVSKYGGDPNLDWTNFKIRRLYYRLRRKGVSEEQAMAQVNAYAQRKLHLGQ